MIEVDIFGLLRSFERSAWRLEALPFYDSPREVEALAAWRAGEPIPSFNAPWEELVAAHVAAGRTLGRVRVVSSPPSEYELFESTIYYPKSAAAGEVIRIADRGRHEDELARLAPEFWLFDDQRAVVLEYDDGAFVRAVDDSVNLPVYLDLQADAMRVSVPLESWVLGVDA